MQKFALALALVVAASGIARAEEAAPDSVTNNEPIYGYGVDYMAPPTAYSPPLAPSYGPFVPLAPLPSARGPFIDDQTVILDPEEELFRRQSDTGDAAG